MVEAVGKIPVTFKLTAYPLGVVIVFRFYIETI